MFAVPQGLRRPYFMWSLMPILTGFLLVLTVQFAPAQEACFRSIPPEDFRPPENDPDLRAFLSSEYESYILEMQDYLNCLGGEHESASQEINQVLARWILYYGRDAALHTKVPGEADGSDE